MHISKIRPLSQVSDATTAIGVYAWYAMPSIGEADWSSEILGSDENAKNNIFAVVEKFSSSIETQPLCVNAKANFSTEWTGEIREKNRAQTDREKRKCWGEKDASRKQLVDAISCSFPLFFSPLYIGRATDQPLRSRLSEHYDKFHRHYRIARRDAGYAERLKESAHDFAGRAVARGFTPSELYFVTFSISENSSVVHPQEIESILTLEYLLNRWSLPILGRR